MVRRTGRFHWTTIVRELKNIDAQCGVQGDAHESEEICIELAVIPSADIFVPALEAALTAHDADASLVAWSARQDRMTNAPAGLKALQVFAQATPAEIEQWVDTNLSNLAIKHRTYLKTMGVAIRLLMDKDGII